VIFFYYSFFSSNIHIQSNKKSTVPGVPWPRFNPWSGNRDPTSCMVWPKNKTNKCVYIYIYDFYKIDDCNSTDSTYGKEQQEGAISRTLKDRWSRGLQLLLTGPDPVIAH
jgi:hypothetical protein